MLAVWLILALLAFALLATGTHEMTWGEIALLAIACTVIAPICLVIGVCDFLYRNNI